MSGLNLSYEIDNGGGEISYFEDRRIKEPLQLANIIAGEIVNEILDNAFDIVSKSNSGTTNWKDSGVCELTETDFITNEHMCLDVVGDIIGAVEEKAEEKEEKLEIRNHRTESLGPYDVVTYDTIHAKGGIGDQPFDDKIDCYANEIETANVRTVEKKSRVTDLIKNSPQLIAEYLMIDEKAKRSQDEWEETEEKIIQVIELDVDGVKLESTPSVFINEEESLDGDLLQVPTDDGMDIIDLSSRAFKEEEKQIVNSQLAKGDQQECPNEQSPLRGNNNVVEGITTHSLIDKQCEELSESKIKENKFKKKKWNFGTKFWGFLKKNNKHQSTSTSKIDKQ